MTDADVIVKGEIHTSRGDYDHERELLTEGVDHLVLEGPEEEAQYGLLQQWYSFALLLMNYLFFRVFYTDSSVLEDIADAQGAEVTKTRESDASILENSHILMRVFAGILFYILFFGSALFGIFGFDRYGVPLLILSAMLPVLMLRIHESAQESGSRNEMMAEKIANAAEDGGRVIAVVGEDHADEVCGHLSDELSTTREEPVYGRVSKEHAKDILYPTFVFGSVLWVFYSIFIEYSLFAWNAF